MRLLFALLLPLTCLAEDMDGLLEEFRDYREEEQLRRDQERIEWERTREREDTDRFWAGVKERRLREEREEEERRFRRELLNALND